MRTLLLPLFFGLTGCAITADQICEGIPLGVPIENVWDQVAPAPIESGCAGGPARGIEGPLTTLACCMKSTSEACNTDCTGQSGAKAFSVGPVVDRHSDTAQCCVLVREGKVAARYVRYD